MPDAAADREHDLMGNCWCGGILHQTGDSVTTPTTTASSHVRDDDARRGSGHPRRADRGPSRGPAHDDALRPGQGEPGQARQLHPGRVHGRGDLERRAEALATLAASYRRVFIR